MEYKMKNGRIMMEAVFSMFTKMLTALTTLGCLILTGWSLFTNHSPLLTFAMLILAGVSGFFTYVDIKNTFTGT